MWPPPKNWNITSTQNTASQPTPASPPEVPGILSFAQCRRVSVLLCLGLSGNGTLQYVCGFSRSMSCLDSYPPCCLWS